MKSDQHLTQNQGVEAFDRELRNHMSGMRSASRELFLAEVSKIANLYGVWDATNKHADVNIHVLCIVFRALRQDHAPYVRDNAAFFHTLSTCLEQYAPDSVSFHVNTEKESARLMVLTNWMELVLSFMPGENNKTLVMALVSALSDAPPYRSGGGVTLY
jgi:hypothetical protein